MTCQTYRYLLRRALLAAGFYLASVFAAQADPLKFTVVKAESLALTGDIVGRYFSLEFTPLDAANSGGGEYLIAVFQDTQIPYSQPIAPVVVEKLVCAAPRCSRAIEAPISPVPYIVGIAKGGAAGAISATLRFAPGATSGTPFHASLDIKSLRINSLIVSYAMPAGYSPTRSGAWLGLWAGSGVGAAEPLAKASIDSAQSQDTQAINGLELRGNFTYTVGIAAGPDSGSIASLAVFKTEPY